VYNYRIQQNTQNTMIVSHVTETMSNIDLKRP